MKFIETSLPGVLKIVPKVHEDGRGYFTETWQARRFRDAGIDMEFVQDNVSQSSKRTLRGLHYQIKQSQGKLVRVVSGEVLDVAVDLRRSSATFGKWAGEIVSAGNKHLLWVPPGFLVLSNTAEFEYKCTDYYAPKFERSIRWDDPEIGIEWPLTTGELPVLSGKNAAAPFLKNAETYA